MDVLPPTWSVLPFPVARAAFFGKFAGETFSFPSNEVRPQFDIVLAAGFGCLFCLFLTGSSFLMIPVNPFFSLSSSVPH